MYCNYHTHTYRCKHASGDVIDYARIAHEQGCPVLGITDHAPFPTMPWGDVRMDMTELDGYLDAIREAQFAYPEMEIISGLECEWVPEHRAHIEDCLLGEGGVRYLVGGIHYFLCDGDWYPMSRIDTPARLRAYADHFITSMETGLFVFMAHPDTFGQAYLPWDTNAAAAAHDICAAAAALQVPLEINGYGMRKPLVKTAQGKRWKYPLKDFWVVAAEYDITVVCNSDAHRPQDVLASIGDAKSIARQHKLSEADLSWLVDG